ncbi:MAG: hypothetical protein EOO61_14635 [Hymenobacter sp.]|nr:MAG: hypothetical protein EOO61_14635 [Hymenobacter sp.]
MNGICRKPFKILDRTCQSVALYKWRKEITHYTTRIVGDKVRVVDYYVQCLNFKLCGNYCGLRQIVYNGGSQRMSHMCFPRQAV